MEQPLLRGARNTGARHAVKLARIIHQGYRAYREAFQAITGGARQRFEAGAWQEVQKAHTRRLALYAQHIGSVSRQIRNALGGREPDPAEWIASRIAYRDIIAREYNAELFETFYNSIHRHLTNDADVTDAEMFVSTAYPSPPIPARDALTRVYKPENGIVEMVREMTEDLPIQLPWRNLDRDIGNVLRSLVDERREISTPEGLSLELLIPVFYRNKAAYVVGRINYHERSWPIAFPLHRDAQGRLYIDTLICDEDELSVVFSFTRAYFMVLTEFPHALVDFLQELLPNKKRSELYAAIGLHKHAKTVFYRDFLEHLDHSSDPFVIAAGIKGMVMTVFTLPSYQIVFKIIKDAFAPQKNITAADVREKYQIVKTHDRVGRMADTQEFENLVLPRNRFDPELLDELLTVAASSVMIEGDKVHIRHVYTERLMTPLNLFIEQASPEEIDEALDEYGNAIKQLAAANIFPGDMLLKNFGITRHGRVVFYDYDEICYLTDVNFRAIPEARTPEEELASEPWYSVGPNDVFPEEFRRFLFGKPGIKRRFTEMHGELFDPEYWKGLQREIRAGHVMDVFPYRRKKRFVRQLQS
ncbi:MAG TPA: bifunctional isocitrate dehydrogenase kinase/phosphatase [Pseudomonadales bacterium]